MNLGNGRLQHQWKESVRVIEAGERPNHANMVIDQADVDRKTKKIRYENQLGASVPPSSIA